MPTNVNSHDLSGVKIKNVKQLNQNVLVLITMYHVAKQAVVDRETFSRPKTLNKLKIIENYFIENC